VRNISRRLSRLEDLWLPPVETKSSRWLRARIESGRRRLAAGQARGEWAPVAEFRARDEQHGPRTQVEILLAGRQRARLE
jgi:hypothetical protein